MSLQNQTHGVSRADALRVWTRIALMSFGGPAGQIAVMHRILVDEKAWVSERRFLHGLNFCMLLPGPEAQQLATYIGWLMHGVAGGVMAGGLFVLPGVIAIMALSIVYALYGGVGLIAGLFFGLKAAVLAIVVEAVLRIGRRALKGWLSRTIAAAAFVAIFLFAAPFPLLIVVAALLGLARALLAPNGGAGGGGGEAPAEASRLGEATPEHALARPGRTLRMAALWGGLWLAPVAALVVLAPGGVFAALALFFSKMALVTFGGAYAVLAYVAQESVQHYHWLRPGEMLDGLGMAETTPGPLIMVLQFVGFLAAFRAPGALSPLTAGILGGLLTTWVTFTPCFLWIFVGGPFVERLRGQKALGAALAAITAAVVGVVLNLAVWFAIHAIFRDSVAVRALGLHFDAPLVASLDPAALGLTIAALLAVFRYHIGTMTTLGLCAAAGAALRFSGFA